MIFFPIIVWFSTEYTNNIYETFTNILICDYQQIQYNNVYIYYLFGINIPIFSCGASKTGYVNINTYYLRLVDLFTHVGFAEYYLY